MFCFFFKQKTASELRISDWSSDVCSSDLVRATPEDMAQGRAPVGSQVLPYPDDPRGLGMIAVERRAVVGGDQLIDASVGQDQYGAPAVNFRFDSAGGRRFARATQENTGKPFAIILDGKVIRSEEHTSELQSLMRISYAVLC